MIKTNNREEYFKTLTNVSAVVDRTIDNYLDNDEFGEYKRIIYEPFFEKKRGAQKVRATLSYLSYCALANINPSTNIDKNISKLIVIPELEIWAEYMANWIFDNKGNVKNNPLIRKKAAVATKSFLEDSIKISLQVGNKYVPLILDASGNVTKGFAKEFDLNMNNKELLEVSFETFKNFYSKNYGIPGIGKSYSLGIDIVSTYLKKQQSIKSRKLSDVFLEFGAWHETLNDLGDFSISGISTDKIDSDQFSDIRNGALTLPIWLMYNSSNESDKEFIRTCVGKNELTESSQAKLVNILFETKTYELVSKQLKRKGRQLRKELKEIGFQNKASKQLQQGISVLESNKIYHSLRESYEHAQKILSETYVPTWSDELL